MEERVSVGGVLGLYRLDQKKGGVNFTERTRVTTVVLFTFLHRLAFSSPPPPRLSPQDDRGRYS